MKEFVNGAIMGAVFALMPIEFTKIGAWKTIVGITVGTIIVSISR